MQSNLVSRPDESAGFGIFCGPFYLEWGIFSTLLGYAVAWVFSDRANEAALHRAACLFQGRWFLRGGMWMDRGFWGYLHF